MATRPSARVTTATHRQSRGASVVAIGTTAMLHPKRQYHYTPWHTLMWTNTPPQHRPLTWQGMEIPTVCTAWSAKPCRSADFTLRIGPAVEIRPAARPSNGDTPARRSPPGRIGRPKAVQGWAGSLSTDRPE